jgi:hypothetical protein
MLMALILSLALSTDAPAPVADGEALIVDSGSTNVAGFRLRVFENGRFFIEQGNPAKGRVRSALVRRFFEDLRAAGSLDRLGQAQCAKSASFGSWTRITYRGETSPDISCPSTTAVQALTRDVGALADAAGIKRLPRLSHRRRPAKSRHRA